MSTQITPSDVEAFLMEELSKVQAIFGDYAGIHCQVYRHIYLSQPAQYEIDWQLYINGNGYVPDKSVGQKRSFSDIMAAMAKAKNDRDPKVQASRLRNQIAELSRRATELEAAS